MKVSNELLIGIAIGAAAALLIAGGKNPVVTTKVPGKYPAPAKNNVPMQYIGIRPWQTAWSAARPLHA